MKNTTRIATLTVLVVGGFLLWQHTMASKATATSSRSSNVSLVDGQQYVTITAKGGYTPATSVVQGGVPTVLRFDTNGAFDCSATVRIPSLHISQTLPSSGTTDISIGTLSAGERITGTCSMGMYRFEVDAQG